MVKVTFNDIPTIYVLTDWINESKDARKSDWAQLAADRDIFRRRLVEFGKIFKCNKTLKNIYIYIIPDVYNCNDWPFYMVVLVGYSIAGLRIVDVVRSRRMLVVWATTCCCRFAPR